MKFWSKSNISIEIKWKIEISVHANQFCKLLHSKSSDEFIFFKLHFYVAMLVSFKKSIKCFRLMIAVHPRWLLVHPILMVVHPNFDDRTPWILQLHQHFQSTQMLSKNLKLSQFDKQHMRCLWLQKFSKSDENWIW